MFTEKDLTILKEKKISLDKVNWQIEQFKKGIAPIKLYKATTIEQGVVQLYDIESYINTYDKASKEVVKFIPASGAASRMFKDLFEFKDIAEKQKDINLEDYPEVKKFFDSIKKFAFYPELNACCESEGGVERLLFRKNYYVILNKLLTAEGMAYGVLPKGLLSFHFYAGGIARTPFEEHLDEGAKYARSDKNIVKLHFTVSPEHVDEFEFLKKKVVKKYEEMYYVKYSIAFSTQKASTDTLAVTPENTPFYSSDDNIFFRPGGHGALIENLNDIDADLIFIKNIDNVVPEKRIASTVKNKKALAGYLCEIQRDTFRLIKSLKGTPTATELHEAKKLIKDTFNISDSSLETENEAELIELLVDRLNRPLRACGVVKNTGETGGGPFLVIDDKGCITPQMVETSQVDLNVPEQKEIFKQSTHFNPVDLVCAVRNYKGKKFNLLDFIDNDTCFISNKSKDGKDLKALELPGLWNGAMAKWNTVFIEVQVDTFNPVKTINDLLRISHQ